MNKYAVVFLLGTISPAVAASSDGCIFGHNDVFLVKDWRVERATDASGVQGTRLIITVSNALKSRVRTVLGTVEFLDIGQGNLFAARPNLSAGGKKTLQQEYFKTGLDLVLKREQERAEGSKRMDVVICVQAVETSRGKILTFDPEPAAVDILKQLPK